MRCLRNTAFADCTIAVTNAVTDSEHNSIPEGFTTKTALRSDMGLETVVVAVGPTEERRVDQLTETVLDVAGPHDATVVLFHAFTEAAFEQGIERYNEDPANPPTPTEMTRRLESINGIIHELEEVGLPYEVVSDIVNPKDGILQVVGDAGADMLFVGGRKRSPIGKALAGSTAHQVMMQASCPVVFVRQGIAAAKE